MVDDEKPTALRSAGGLLLAGMFVETTSRARSATVLVRGGSVTRDEGGFFSRSAAAAQAQDRVQPDRLGVFRDGAAPN